MSNAVLIGPASPAAIGGNVSQRDVSPMKKFTCPKSAASLAAYDEAGGIDLDPDYVWRVLRRRFEIDPKTLRQRCSSRTRACSRGHERYQRAWLPSPHRSGDDPCSSLVGASDRALDLPSATRICLPRRVDGGTLDVSEQRLDARASNRGVVDRRRPLLDGPGSSRHLSARAGESPEAKARRQLRSELSRPGRRRREWPMQVKRSIRQPNRLGDLYLDARPDPAPRQRQSTYPVEARAPVERWPERSWAMPRGVRGQRGFHDPDRPSHRSNLNNMCANPAEGIFWSGGSHLRPPPSHCHRR